MSFLRNRRNKNKQKTTESSKLSHETAKKLKRLTSNYEKLERSQKSKTDPRNWKEIIQDFYLLFVGEQNSISDFEHCSKFANVLQKLFLQLSNFLLGQKTQPKTNTEISQIGQEFLGCSLKVFMFVCKKILESQKFEYVGNFSDQKTTQQTIQMLCLFSKFQNGESSNKDGNWTLFLFFNYPFLW
ncbi:hypothetical protein M0813_28502 [Anaeramoeba flamelloides]|uniref:Uncharacterized protein n=1 Tax=Anaeramoeba flamelloides TaxID=1746091 RepID=A0ABQ8XUC3_9EUKA|nr:hypothetical protein M0813_28502 [Anaeramoeba flamelloides]